MTRPTTRKLPAHRGVFSYGRVHEKNGCVVYRLFRRSLDRRVHGITKAFDPSCERNHIARELNIARHQLRNTVDEIDLEIMGVTQ